MVADVGRKATSTIKAVNRMAILAHADVSGAAKMRAEVNKYKEESEKVRWELATLLCTC